MSLHPVEPSFGTTVSSVRTVGRRQVLDDLPRRAEHRRTLLERALGLRVVVPVLADDRVLILQQRDRRIELLLVQRVRILDTEIGLRSLQVQRRVGDVDRCVVRGDLARVRRCLVEHHAPRIGRRRDDIGVPHQIVGTPAVRDAVVLPVARVVLLLLEERREVGVVLDERRC